MKFVSSAFFLCICLAMPDALASDEATLPEPVTTALRHARIPLSSVGIIVQEVDAPSPLIAVNATQPMNPASTMKLLTTFAALETLGPAYRWKTEAYLDGKLENGVLQGNLIFKGYGDPKLTIEEFWMWLRELRQRGLRDIRGDIVLDHGFFVDANQDPSEFDNDPTRAYNVGTNALLLNFNAIHLQMIPDGPSAIALLEPELAGYTLQNNISTSARLRCHGPNAFTVRLDGHVIKLEGKIPANCGEVDEYFSLLPHDEYFFAAFGALWQELGGTLQGKLRVGTAPVGIAPYARYVSPELSEIIRDINKFSNNIMARQVFLTLGTTDPARGAASAVPAAGNGGTEMNGEPTDSNVTDVNVSSAQAGGDTVVETPATPAQALQQVANDIQSSASVPRSISWMREWLKAQQLQFPELVLENGSGLSRKERISPRHLAQILQRVTHSRFSSELESSLPILGMDGTVKRRFMDSELAGHAHLKTGTLDGVKSMAGYVDAANGKKWIVVFIINHPHAAKGQAAQDALIEWVQRQGQ
jgi:D-alanyl-D-alanine carboxypeptidase/D-alanyl-D-alanine-endopeptidase (penicillin-binding protein 4)